MVKVNNTPNFSIKHTSETGAILIVAPLLILLLLLFSGAWLDISNRALRQGILQKIADITAIGAGSARVNNNTQEHVNEIAQSIALENLLTDGFKNPQISDISTQYSSSENFERFEVSLTGYTDNFLAHILFGSEKRLKLFASATVEIPAIAAVITLDLSSSMCNEQTPNTGETNCPRFLKSKQAMKKFASMLSTTHDYLGIHCFGTYACGDPESAEVHPIPLLLDSSHFKEQDAIDSIEQIALFKNNPYLSWTNTTAALESSAAQFDNIPEETLAKTKKYIILVTDGNPSHPTASGNKIPIENAILKADELREKGFIIYALGFGELADEESPDPYQSDQGSRIRGIVLRRIVNDPQGISMADPEFHAINNNIPTYATLRALNHPQGRFIFADDTTPNHADMMDEIIKISKLRLVK